MTVDFKTARAMLKAMGFIPWLKYVKEREVYRLGKAVITLDKLNRYGYFLEIEGSMKNILALEKKLQLTSADAEPRSYLAIILKKPRL